MYDERLRPQFHFSARENWHNDPNGLVAYNGVYHLFFQYNPLGLQWGNMTWGHAVGTDLLHWRQGENVLEPDELGTMFSGSAVVDWDNTSGFQNGEHPPIVLIYTAAGGTSPESQGQPFTQCLAYSTDGGERWQKFTGNPVLGCLLAGNRDPKVIWHAPTQRWVMTLYLDGNDFAFFSSPDLQRWTHLHDLSAPGSIECPDFFDLPVEGEPGSRKWAWVAGDGRYYVGAFDGERFTPETELLTGDWGASFYACQSFSDLPPADGRRIQMAWMRGGEYPDMPFNQQMSLPCELRLHRTPHGLRLSRWPVREIAALHAQRRTFGPIQLEDQAKPLDGPAGGLYDISCTIQAAAAESAGLRVHGIPIAYRPQDGVLACLGKEAPLQLQGRPLRLRVLVDRASIEVFAEDGLVSMTSCYLPAEEDARIHVFAQGGAASFSSVTVQTVQSIWTSQ